MKILHLYIKNLASIEEAEIDFENGPLSQDPIFLICGETGSGKTTILNAISLALYAKVPSLEKDNSAGTDSDNLKTDNPAMLLRRGTAGCEVALTFCTADGHRYLARWEAWRLRKRKNSTKNPNDKLYDSSRSLQDLKSGVTYTRVGDVKSKIQELVGLSFEQFTRTVLLAQGDFAAFLKADQKDKTDILEKLTGTDVYSEIGQSIFACLRSAEAEVKDTQTQIGKTESLAPEEVAALLARIGEIDLRIPALNKERAVLHAAVEWLNGESDLRKKKAEAAARESSAASAVNSDENLQMQQLIADWDSTAEIRATLRDMHAKIREVESDCGVITGIERGLWRDVADGSEWLKAESDSLAARIRGLEAQLEAGAPLLPVLRLSQELGEDARVVSERLASAKAHRDEAALSDKHAAEAEKKLEPMKQEVEKAKTACAKAEAEVEVCKTAAAAYDTAALTAALDARKQAADAIGRAAQSAAECRTKEKDLALSTEALAEAEKRVGETRRKQADDKSLLETSRLEHQRMKALYEGQKELKDHIASLRASFAETGTCPLCGTAGVHLHTDEAIDRVLGESKQRAAEAEKAYEAAMAAVNADTAALGVQQREADRLGKIHKAKEKEYSDARARLLADCKALSLPDGADISPEALGEMASEAQKSLDSALGMLAEALNKQKALEKANENLKKADRALTRANDELAKCETAASDLRKKAGFSLQQAESLERAADEAFEAFVGRLACDDEAGKMLGRMLQAKNIELKRDQAVRVALEVKSVKAEREKLEEEKTVLDRKAEAASAALQQVADALEKCAAIHTPEPYSPSPRGIADLSQKSGDLYTRLYSAYSRLKDDIAKKEAFETAVAAYCESSPLSREKLEGLNGIPQPRIDVCRTKVKERANELEKAKAVLQEYTRYYEEHLQKPHDIAPDETVETITARLGAADEEFTALQSEKIEKESTLKKDRDAKAEKADLEALLKEQRLVCDRWQRLNAIFGAADGSKFRTIAQSYVLRMLLSKANYYLRMLSPRYELMCEDGSLVINVRDMHQGGALRYVGLLSGGETFIVSLALALALSSISKDRIDVDTLFIDEGFGTLDHNTLETVIDTLDRLHHMGGRRIGIISHVDDLKERIGTQLCLVRTSASSSTIKLKTP